MYAQEVFGDTQGGPRFATCLKASIPNEPSKFAPPFVVLWVIVPPTKQNAFPTSFLDVEDDAATAARLFGHGEQDVEREGREGKIARRIVGPASGLANGAA